MHRFVSMKQSCDCARVHVRAPARGRRPISDHSGPHELIAVRAVAEVREHVLRRAVTVGHWRLRWRAILREALIFGNGPLAWLTERVFTGIEQRERKRLAPPWIRPAEIQI